jgi:DNA-directed RNA polymerase I, II, and III subunit RPABC2
MVQVFKYCKMQDDNSMPNSTIARMTKFEKAQVIGMRTEQIARGAPPTIVVPDGSSVRDIVIAELADKKCPLIVSRTLPNGRIETFKVHTMEIPDY